METKMLSINQNNCDKRPTSMISDPLKNIVNMSLIDEKSNRLYGTTKTLEAIKTIETIDTMETMETTQNNSHGKLRKIQSFECDFSLMNLYTDDNKEIYIKTEFENKSLSEKDDEIFYDSTIESEDKDFEEQDDTSQHDPGINCTEEEQTASKLLNSTEEQKRMEQSKSLRMAFDVILRLTYPLARDVVKGITSIRDVRFLKVIRCIASSHRALTNLFAYAANIMSLNLSSVQVSQRIEPFLRLLKIRISRDCIESLADPHTKLHGGKAFISPPSPNSTMPNFSSFSRLPRYSLPDFQAGGNKIYTENEATKCCTLKILAEPPSGQPIRADIVFIHGLNGSLNNTWKQGLWENERKPVEFQRPPKPPVRPPKRPKHSRTTAAHPSHQTKRARFAYAQSGQRYFLNGNDNDNDSKEIQICDGIESSFPTFRLRMHDSGRLLQAEQNYKLQDGNNKESNKELFDENEPSNDPNYSQCWPGDWLPIDCPGVRVVALNYTTDEHLWRPLWKAKETRSNLVQRSREMIELLIKHRIGYGHPIVWVGHSKGGLFIKQIIVDAWESGRPAAAPLWRSAKGVFFYSVPHRGSHLASIKAPFLQRSVELIDVEKNNKYLLDLHRRFAGLYHLGHLKMEVFSFVETALTLMSVLFMRIVSVDSGDPGIGDVCGIRLDHREICKPRGRDCILYKQLVNMINKVS